MQTANQNMAVGCIMIVFALTVGISSVLRQSIDALHHAVQNTACILLQAKWSVEMMMSTILKTVEHAMHGANSTMCPIYL